MAKAAGTFAVLLGGGTSTRGMAKAAGTFAVLLGGGVDLKAQGGRQEKGEDEKGGQALREEDAAAKR